MKATIVWRENPQSASSIAGQWEPTPVPASSGFAGTGTVLFRSHVEQISMSGFCEARTKLSMVKGKDTKKQ